MPRVNTETMETILQNLAALGETSPEETNAALLALVEEACKQIDRDAAVDERRLLRVCNANSGLGRMLRRGAESASDRYKQEFRRAEEEIHALDARLELERNELAELEKRKKKSDNIRRSIEEVAKKTEEYRNLEEKLREDLETLRSFGVTDGADGKIRIEEAAQILDKKMNELVSASALVRKLAEEATRARNGFRDDQLLCARELLSVLEENEKALAQLTEQTQAQAAALADKLKEDVSALENYRNKLSSATADIRKTQAELDRHVKAFRAHKEENKALYRLLKTAGADDFGVLREQIAALDTSLEAALKPYDELLARLCSMRQEEIDAKLEGIEKRFSISVKTGGAE